MSKLKLSTVTVHFILSICIVISLFNAVLAIPTPQPDARIGHTFSQLHDRDIVQTNASGTTGVYDPTTDQEVPQGTPSDGSGSAFSIPDIIWTVFSFAVGTPLLLAGVRGWCFTTGAAIGLSLALCSWAAFANNMGAGGIPDVVLVSLVLALFGVGFGVGLLEIGRLAGLLLLAILGGLSVGIRIILLRPGLLITGTHLYILNWVLIALFGLASTILLVSRQRAGITCSCASIGTFLCVLGLDLTLNKQSGLSLGLRYLFDRNPSHLVDILNIGYNPPKLMLVFLAISIILIPMFAYMQHRLFPHPFYRISPDDDDDHFSISADNSAAETKPPSLEFTGLDIHRENSISNTTLSEKTKPHNPELISPGTPADSISKAKLTEPTAVDSKSKTIPDPPSS